MPYKEKVKKQNSKSKEDSNAMFIFPLCFLYLIVDLEIVCMYIDPTKDYLLTEGVILDNKYIDYLNDLDN